MEIRVLGTGSRGNCYFVRMGGTALLLECGIPIREIRKRLGMAFLDVDACLISHSHKDHSLALKDVLKAGIACMTSRSTADALGIDDFRLTRLEDAGGRASLPGGPFLQAFPLEHDVTGHLGFRIQSSEGVLVYITDTMYSRYTFPGMTHLMIECNYIKEILDENVRQGRVPVELRNRIVQTHMSLETVKKLLEMNNLTHLQEIHLLHLSDQNSDEGWMKREIQAIAGVPVYVA